MRLEPEPRPDGPWDDSEVRDPAEGRVDLGGPSSCPESTAWSCGSSRGRRDRRGHRRPQGQRHPVEAFAAPKREGIWGEVREEIATGITQQGVIDEVEGPLGWELRAQVPVQLPDGTVVSRSCGSSGVDRPPGSCVE